MTKVMSGTMNVKIQSAQQLLRYFSLEQSGGPTGRHRLFVSCLTKLLPCRVVSLRVKRSTTGGPEII